MKIKDATKEQVHAVELAIFHVKKVRELLTLAECTETVARARELLKCVEGAQRHILRRRARTEAAMMVEARSLCAAQDAATAAAEIEGVTAQAQGHYQQVVGARPSRDDRYPIVA